MVVWQTDVSSGHRGVLPIFPQSLWPISSSVYSTKFNYRTHCRVSRLARCFGSGIYPIIYSLMIFLTKLAFSLAKFGFFLSLSWKLV